MIELRDKQCRMINPWRARFLYRGKPLSVNSAHTMRKSKTAAYREYEKNLIPLLEKIKITDIDPTDMYLKIHFVFGFSNNASDVDNPIKPLLDIMQNHIGFNDKIVRELSARKNIVLKGGEYAYVTLQEIFE